MEESTYPPQNAQIASNNSLIYKIIAVWLAGTFALGFAGWVGEYISLNYTNGDQYRYWFQAIIMSTIVISTIVSMRKFWPRDQNINIGVGNFRSGLSYFGLGIGLMLIPLILTLLITHLAGWGNVNFNTSQEIVNTFLSGILITFLFEALPEELLFRGFIFSYLNKKYKRWVSGIIAVLLFVLVPVVLFIVDSIILNKEVYIAGQNTLRISYLITMLIFGIFLQYLRILSGSIWVGVGFHLIFVFFNRILGLEPTKFIQMTEVQNETGMQIVIITLLILVFIGLILYPLYSKRKIGWNQVQ